MKKKTTRTWLVGVLIFTVLGSGLLALINYEAPGIVAIEGYPHAVALCEWEDMRDVEFDQVDDVMYTWGKDGVMYTVNWGHLEDEEVKQLEKKAFDHCFQYMHPALYKITTKGYGTASP